MIVSASKKPLHLNMKKRIQIFPKNKNQREALTKWLIENKIPYEETESTYDPGIIKKILEARRDIERGNFVKYSPDILWK